LEDYLANRPQDGPLPRMPPALADLLRKCFRADPGERWASMAEVADVLQQIYREVAGHEYARSMPASSAQGAVPTAAHDRQTRGGRWIDPREWLLKAFRAEGRDAREIESLPLPHRGSRQAQAIADLAGYAEAQRIYEQLVAGGRKDLEPSLAL